MKIRILEEPRIICQNPASPHCYFGWPTVGRLPDGSLLTVASGLRVAHVCPFGKVIGIRSRDEGRTWSNPEVLIDTPLDDRDAGLLPLANGRVILTSFTNTPDFQRGYADRTKLPYVNAYLDLVEAAGGWEQYHGATLAVSRDGGHHFSLPSVVPLSSPHGPCQLADGTVLYVGSVNSEAEAGRSCIECHTVDEEGRLTFRSRIENGDEEGLRYNEPHARALRDGRILVHIRAENYRTGIFTLFESVSEDGGYTFTKPRRLLSDAGGAPAHILELSDGTVLSVYGHRAAPYGIRAMVSRDGGRSYETDLVLTDAEPSADLGYPSSVELADGAILTVYYAKLPTGNGSALKQIIYRIEE